MQDSIYNQVILAENVIIGEIPSTYYNFKGIENESDYMQTIQ